MKSRHLTIASHIPSRHDRSSPGRGDGPALGRATALRTRAVLLGLASVALLDGCGIANKVRGGNGASNARTSAAAKPSSSVGGATAGGPTLAKVQDEGITNQVHGKYVGQIVFASRAIDRDAPDNSQLVAEFFADEIIYGRAYLPHSLENEPVFANGSDKPLRNTASGFEYKLVVDGKPLDALLEWGEVRRDRRAHTTQQVWPHPLAADGKTSSTWVDLVKGLAPGKHEVRVELWPRQGSYRARAPLAKGTLTLHKTADTKIGTGRTAADLQAGMTDEALVRQLTKLSQAYAKKNGWKESIPNVTIESRDWAEIMAPKSRTVVARQIGAWVHLTAGDECGAQRVVFEQKVNVLKGPVGAIYVKGPGDRTELDCASVDIAPDRWSGRTRARPRPTKG